MKDKDLTGSNQSNRDSYSGLRSANDMSDPCPDQGWGGEAEISGVDNVGGSSVKSASDSGVDMGGPVGSTPAYHNPNGPSADDSDFPLMITMNVGEEPGPKDGAGLRSAVGESPQS